MAQFNDPTLPPSQRYFSWNAYRDALGIDPNGSATEMLWLESFQEIRVCSVVVTLLCVNCPRHAVNRGLQRRRDVDGVRASAAGCQCCLGFWNISQSEMNLTFHQVRLNQ